MRTPGIGDERARKDRRVRTAEEAKRRGRVLARSEYLAVSYDAKRVPFGPYPGQLCGWIHENLLRQPGRLLDVGCGRGEFMAGFHALGYEVFGIDISPAAPELVPEFEVRVADLESAPLPYPPETFDYVFSKSVIEHLRDPDAFLTQCTAALRPGGIALIMTPSWVHTYWGPFYIDHTHVTPFTAPSLEQALVLAGLHETRVRHFYQLPSVWRWPGVSLLCKTIAALPIPFRPFFPGAPWPESVNKFIRFSNELMLLGTGIKPMRAETRQE
jgi:SAM-dependent methyltransferase